MTIMENTILTRMRQVTLTAEDFKMNREWAKTMDPGIPGRIVLEDADLTGNQLGGGNFTGARLANCLARGVFARISRLDRAELEHCDFSEMNWGASTFEAAQISGCNFSHANLSSTVWDHAKVRGCRFDDCDFLLPLLHHAHFSISSFSNAKIGGVKADGLVFENCNFKDADFTGTHLQNSIFQHCDLRGVQFKRSTWENVTLENCKLHGSSGPFKLLSGLKAVSCDLSPEGNGSLKGGSADVTGLWTN